MKAHPSWLKLLRQDTQTAHQRVEDFTRVETKLLREIPDFTNYKSLILAHYLFQNRIALKLKEINFSLLDWPDCKRIPALISDSLQLKINLEMWEFPLPISHEAYILGLLYVAEGSCMGNSMLYKKLSRNSTFKMWGADAFLSSCHEEAGGRWKLFLGKMAPYVESHYPALLAGALDGFSFFENCWQKAVSFIET